MTTTPYFLCTIWSPANKFSAHLAHRPYMFNSGPFNSSLFCLPSFSYDLFITRVTRLPKAPSHFFFAPERKMEETQENEFMAYIFMRRYKAVFHNWTLSTADKTTVYAQKTLTFKMRPSAQHFLWKWVLVAWKWKVISTPKAEHLTSFWYRDQG